MARERFIKEIAEQREGLAVIETALEAGRVSLILVHGEAEKLTGRGRPEALERMAKMRQRAQELGFRGTEGIDLDLFLPMFAVEDLPEGEWLMEGVVIKNGRLYMRQGLRAEEAMNAWERKIARVSGGDFWNHCIERTMVDGGTMVVIKENVVFDGDDRERRGEKAVAEILPLVICGDDIDGAFEGVGYVGKPTRAWIRNGKEIEVFDGERVLGVAIPKEVLESERGVLAAMRWIIMAQRAVRKYMIEGDNEGLSLAKEKIRERVGQLLGHLDFDSIFYIKDGLLFETEFGDYENGRIRRRALTMLSFMADMTAIDLEEAMQIHHESGFLRLLFGSSFFGEDFFTAGQLVRSGIQCPWSIMRASSGEYSEFEGKWRRPYWHCDYHSQEIAPFYREPPLAHLDTIRAMMETSM